jgi:DNA-binding transcriptional LysR family regulator
MDSGEGVEGRAAGDPGVQLRHLSCLVAIAQEGTLTDAAIRLRLSQPAVSRALAQLEARVGVPLVHRTTRRLELTAAGWAFHAAAVRALAAVDDAVAAARGRAGPLRVGFAWSAAGRYTNPLLRAWRSRHPDVPIELSRHDDRTAGLAAGRVDLALVRVPLDADRYAAEELYDEPRCVVVPADHPLRADLRLGDLAGRPLAVVSAYGTTTLDLWPEGARPRIVADLDNIDDWLTVIGSGQALGVTAASTAHRYPRPDLRYLTLLDAPAVTTWLAWDPAGPPHPHRDRFRELAHQVVRDAG